ncbi:gamma-glutamylcyclotransferase family protein [Cecembia rubra]|uniref:AIG2 family protein n=1 Tax=Cecembia rubra TaxID=1485585 RepID=A0A2P8DTA6_9BACT|nr:gamma-glutamylcyclotransferase family protein [Cecembia rubra]PSL00450.1 AIG2 family protein [Cecembia rubra]
MEKFYYFGYASNLDESTLEGRLKHKPQKIGIAVLPHFGFRFSHPNPDGTARANIVPSENESVYGMLYEIKESDRPYFLNSEPGYEFVEKVVFSQKGKILAYTFISSKNETGIFPAEDYWKLIIKGGKENGIPNTYLSNILNRVGKSPLLDWDQSS